MKLLAVGKCQMEESTVRRVEYAEPIFARLNLQIGKQFPIHQNRIAEAIRYPRRFRVWRDGVIQLAFQVEKTVANCQRNLILAFGQVQPFFKTVYYEKIAEQSGIHVQPRDSQGMVVVPQ